MNIRPYIEDISVSHFEDKDIPQFHPSQVWFALSRLDVNKATVPGDLPAKLIKQFATYLAEPLTDIFNTGLRKGEYPQIYKFEVCTPVPKVHPPQSTSQLRNISGLLTFVTFFEKLISQLIILTWRKSWNLPNLGIKKGSLSNIILYRCCIEFFLCWIITLRGIHLL